MLTTGDLVAFARANAADARRDVTAREAAALVWERASEADHAAGRRLAERMTGSRCRRSRRA
jgi:hypothetical protein